MKYGLTFPWLFGVYSSVFIRLSRGRETEREGQWAHQSRATSRHNSANWPPLMARLMAGRCRAGDTHTPDGAADAAISPSLSARAPQPSRTVESKAQDQRLMEANCMIKEVEWLAYQLPPSSCSGSSRFLTCYHDF